MELYSYNITAVSWNQLKGRREDMKIPPLCPRHSKLTSNDYYEMILL